MVQFYLSSIYNSAKFTDTDDLFVVLPKVMVVAYSTSSAGTIVALVAGKVNIISLKNNFIHNQADVSINGNTADDVQPHVKLPNSFKREARCLSTTLNLLDILSV